MKRKYAKLSAIISLIFCISIISPLPATAYPSIDTNELSVYTETENSYTKILNSALNFVCSLFPSAPTQPAVSVGKAEVWFLFVNFRSEPKLSSENIIAQFWVGREVRIKSIDGLWARVEDTETKEEGYIFKLFLRGPSTPINITREYDHIYTGQTKEGRITVSYSGEQTITWSLSKEGIISFDKSDLSFTGISPGTVTLTAKAGSKKDSVTITCINEWEETETSTSTNSVNIRKNPGTGYGIKATVPSGTQIVARGDLADGSDWIYVSANSEWGFIQLSDFSGIDYLMTEYHYYDKGYEKRFGSSETKILSYASVLNDVMMANFKLKVCPYVKPYTSAADQCKILSYVSVTTDNLASSCPQTGDHNAESCLTRNYVRTQFTKVYGNGNNVVGKCVWTGHIFDNHQGSAAQFPSETVIFTTGNTVTKTSSGTYSNKSDYYIRYFSLYEIVHETGHLLGLNDGYCFGKDSFEEHCANPNCYSCNDETVPDCIMAKRFSPENKNTIFCEECISTIESHLKNHH